jgi:hypothetical protein
MSNGPSKDVLFQIAHTAGLPNHAAWLFLFSLILAGRLPAVTSDAPATDCGHAGRPLATEGIQGGRLNQAGESAAPLPMPPEPAAFTRTGLSAVTLEPLRPRAAHIVQLRSIAAVRQGGSDGPENGQ